MARYTSSMLLLAILLVACNPLPSKSQILINGVSVTTLNFAGVLYCSPTGNPVPGSNTTGVAGASITLVCNGVPVTTNQIFTNVTGAFNIVVNVVQGLLFNPASCLINVPLPLGLGSCTALPPTGVLSSVPILQSVVNTGVLGGGVANYLAGLFGYFPAA